MGKILVYCKNCAMFCTGKKSVKWESVKWENRLNGKGIGAQMLCFVQGKNRVNGNWLNEKFLHSSGKHVGTRIVWNSGRYFSFKQKPIAYHQILSLIIHCQTLYVFRRVFLQCKYSFVWYTALKCTSSIRKHTINQKIAYMGKSLIWERFCCPQDSHITNSYCIITSIGKSRVILIKSDWYIHEAFLKSSILDVDLSPTAQYGFTRNRIEKATEAEWSTRNCFSRALTKMAAFTKLANRELLWKEVR